MEEYRLARLDRTDAAETAAWTALLAREGIRPDPNLEYTVVLLDSKGSIVATGSCFHNTLRCFAVDHAHRGEGLLNQVVTHLMDYEFQRGICHLLLHTKCSTAPFFQELGFHEIARVEGRVVLLENQPHGFSSYLRRLTRGTGRQAAIVMNANPFTLGHRRLIETACGACDTLHLFLVSEDVSQFSYEVRKRLVQEGTKDLKNVLYHETGSYLISTAVFPSYFFPSSQEVTQAQAELDCQVFLKIARTLDITVRYVGDEPLSTTTAIYNRALQRILPPAGVSVREIPRLEADGTVISASKVRQIIGEEQPSASEQLSRLLPPTTYQCLLDMHLIK